MLEESIFDYRYARLYDVDIPKEKRLNYLQTVETPDQTPHLHRLPVIRLGVLNGLNVRSCS